MNMQNAPTVVPAPQSEPTQHPQTLNNLEICPAAPVHLSPGVPTIIYCNAAGGIGRSTWAFEAMLRAIGPAVLALGHTGALQPQLAGYETFTNAECSKCGHPGPADGVAVLVRRDICLQRNFKVEVVPSVGDCNCNRFLAVKIPQINDEPEMIVAVVYVPPKGASSYPSAAPKLASCANAFAQRQREAATTPLVLGGDFNNPKPLKLAGLQKKTVKLYALSNITIRETPFTRLPQAHAQTPSKIDHVMCNKAADSVLETAWAAPLLPTADHLALIVQLRAEALASWATPPPSPPVIPPPKPRMTAQEAAAFKAAMQRWTNERLHSITAAATGATNAEALNNFVLRELLPEVAAAQARVTRRTRPPIRRPPPSWLDTAVRAVAFIGLYVAYTQMQPRDDDALGSLLEEIQLSLEDPEVVKAIGCTQDEWDGVAANGDAPELFVMWQEAKQQLRESALKYTAEVALAKQVADIARAWSQPRWINRRLKAGVEDSPQLTCLAERTAGPLQTDGTTHRPDNYQLALSPTDVIALIEKQMLNEDMASQLPSDFSSEHLPAAFHPPQRPPTLPARPVSYQEFAQCLKAMPYKAAGPDRVTAHAMRLLPEPLLSALWVFLVRVGEADCLPIGMVSAKIVLLYKKGNPVFIENWRPIALLNTIARLYDAIHERRISLALRSNAAIPPTQFAFKPGMAATVCMEGLLIKWHLLNEQKDEAGGVHHDFAQAYPSVEHAILKHSLVISGVPESEVHAFGAMYGSATATVEAMGTETARTKVCKGLLQGTSSGCVVFTAHQANLDRALTGLGHLITLVGVAFDAHHQFADDLFTFCLTIAIMLVQWDTICRFAEAATMKLAPPKGEFLALPSMNPLPTEWEQAVARLKIGDKPISVTPPGAVTRSLGFFYTPRDGMARHAEKVAESIAARVAAISSSPIATCYALKRRHLTTALARTIAHGEQSTLFGIRGLQRIHKAYVSGITASLSLGTVSRLALVTPLGQGGAGFPHYVIETSLAAFEAMSKRLVPHPTSPMEAQLGQAGTPDQLLRHDVFKRAALVWAAFLAIPRPLKTTARDEADPRPPKATGRDKADWTTAALPEGSPGTNLLQRCHLFKLQIPVPQATYDACCSIQQSPVVAFTVSLLRDQADSLSLLAIATLELVRRTADAPTLLVEFLHHFYRKTVDSADFARSVRAAASRPHPLAYQEDLTRLHKAARRLEKALPSPDSNRKHKGLPKQLWGLTPGQLMKKKPTYLAELVALPVRSPRGVPSLQIVGAPEETHISSEVQDCIQAAREKVSFALQPQTPVGERREQWALLPFEAPPAATNSFSTPGVGRPITPTFILTTTTPTCVLLDRDAARTLARCTAATAEHSPGVPEFVRRWLKEAKHAPQADKVPPAAIRLIAEALQPQVLLGQQVDYLPLEATSDCLILLGHEHRTRPQGGINDNLSHLLLTDPAPTWQSQLTPKDRWTLKLMRAVATQGGGALQWWVQPVRCSPEASQSTSFVESLLYQRGVAFTYDGATAEPLSWTAVAALSAGPSTYPLIVYCACAPLSHSAAVAAVERLQHRWTQQFVHGHVACTSPQDPPEGCVLWTREIVRRAEAPPPEATEASLICFRPALQVADLIARHAWGDGEENPVLLASDGSKTKDGVGTAIAEQAPGDDAPKIWKFSLKPPPWAPRPTSSDAELCGMIYAFERAALLGETAHGSVPTQAPPTTAILHMDPLGRLQQFERFLYHPTNYLNHRLFPTYVRLCRLIAEARHLQKLWIVKIPAHIDDSSAAPAYALHSRCDVEAGLAADKDSDAPQWDYNKSPGLLNPPGLPLYPEPTAAEGEEGSNNNDPAPLCGTALLHHLHAVYASREKVCSTYQRDRRGIISKHGPQTGYARAIERVSRNNPPATLRTLDQLLVGAQTIVAATAPNAECACGKRPICHCQKSAPCPAAQDPNAPHIHPSPAHALCCPATHDTVLSAHNELVAVAAEAIARVRQRRSTGRYHVYAATQKVTSFPRLTPGKGAYQPDHLGQETWARLERGDKSGNLAGYHDADIVVDIFGPSDLKAVWAFDVALTELRNLDSRHAEKEQYMAAAKALVELTTKVPVYTVPVVVSLEGLVHSSLVSPLQALGFTAPEISQLMADLTHTAVHGAINIRRLYMSHFFANAAAAAREEEGCAPE